MNYRYFETLSAPALNVVQVLTAWSFCFSVTSDDGLCVVLLMLTAVLVVSWMYANRGPKAPKIVGREELPLPKGSWRFSLKWEDAESAVSVCGEVKIATQVVLHRSATHWKSLCSLPASIFSPARCSAGRIRLFNGLHESLQDRLTRRPKSPGCANSLLDTRMLF